MKTKTDVTPEPSVLWFNHKKKCVRTDDVVYLKSFDNYTRFYLSNGRQFLSSHTMKIYEQQLQSKGDFTRVHRGTLLNLKYLTKFEKNTEGNWACLSTGEKIFVSRRKIKKFEEHTSSNFSEN
ncbi:LytTR family DNA-binding domain-containing protein [Emticicia sp. BO119]|uniref:LytR/AlgR family response regulator transcription factor n=1 Tax=Emticicia sp. BO119 TaxID=2757768 RepID=UPI0015F11324|nr:LytTR family DNA-binding domain-containing protein [Emticicia sp. BO119]MBA4851219.1 LytTR family transcriptional regulator [Emticicia sp. BO119]